MWFYPRCFLLLCLSSSVQADDTQPWFGIKLPTDNAKSLDNFRQAYREQDLEPLSLRLPAESDPFGAIRGDEVYAMLEDIVTLTVDNRPEGAQYWGRIAGDVGERAAAAYLQDRFEAFGLDDVRTEPVTGGPQWWPVSWRVTLPGDPAYGAGSEDLTLTSAFPALQIGQGPLDIEGLTAELVFAGRGQPLDLMGRDVRGKIVVIRSVMQADPFFQSARGHVGAIAAAGAVGVLILLDTPGNHRYALEGLGPPGVPCFAIGGDDGRFLEALLLAADDQTPISARLDIQAEVRDDWQGENIVARIPGQTDENVIVIAHLDGYFESANDNGGGLAAMLALARFFANPGREPPQRNLIFVGTSAHHEKSDGARSFIETHPDLLDNTLLVVNIEHPSSIMTTYRGPLKFERFTLPGQFLTSTSQGTRAWTVSNRNETLIDIFREAVDRYGIVVNSVMERLPTGDAFDFYRSGVPVVQMLDANLWFHADADVAETIHPHGLERATRAHAYLLERIDAMPSEALTRKK